MLDALLSPFAPHSCCGCGYLGSVLCEVCKNDIISEPYALCLVCSKPTGNDNICNRCRKVWGVSRGWAVGERNDHLKALLDKFKFHSARQAGLVCAQLLHERLPLLPSNVAIVPVPTAPAHSRVRGFDHTGVIVRILARKRGLRVMPMLRRSSSGTQHFKTRAERLKTAAEGLELRGRVPETILLVDDICTTGATLQACVKKLRENGAKQVFVAIIARQPLDG